MKVAITGGTGFIGSHLAQELRRQGNGLVIISRGVNERKQVLQGLPDESFAPVGLDSTDALAEAFDGCDSVVHCAGINREKGTQTYQRVHVEGTRNVVEAARRAGVMKVILISFLRARPDCGSGYHESKYAAEEIVRNSGLDYTVVKEGITYGNGDHMISHLAWAAKHFPVFGLVGIRSKPLRPVAVSDVVKILVVASTSERLSRSTIAVMGPEVIPLREALRRVGEVVGSNPLTVPLPIWFHYVLGALCERVMKVPLISKAQVRILSEGLTESLPAAAVPPEDLTPKTVMGEAEIRAALVH